MKLLLIRDADPDAHSCIDQVLIVVGDDQHEREVLSSESISDFIPEPEIAATVYFSVDSDLGRLADEMGDNRPYSG